MGPSLLSWLSRILSRPQSSRTKSAMEKWFRPHLESLEERLAPTVTLFNPGPQNSLTGDSVNLYLMASDSAARTCSPGRSPPLFVGLQRQPLRLATLGLLRIAERGKPILQKGVNP